MKKANVGVQEAIVQRQLKLNIQTNQRIRKKQNY